MPSNPEVPGLRLRRAALALLGVCTPLALFSLAQGIRNALERSQDFQWSGARMLLSRIDPWSDYLAGDPHHLIHLSQIPNYLPVLYLLIAPLGLLPLAPAALVWALLNGGFAVSSGWLAARFYGTGRIGTLLVICLLLMASPTRQTIGNGQQGLLVLLLWCVSLLSVRLSDTRAAVAGISYFKFNFAPATFLYLLFRRGVRAVLWSTVPSVAATLILWLWLTHARSVAGLRDLISGPFAVSRTGYFPSGGDPNLMDALQVVLFRSYAPGTLLPRTAVPGWVNVTGLTLALLLCGALLYLAVRKIPGSSVQWQMALLGTASFGLFKHHSYDAVVLLFPLCHALRLWRDVRAKVAAGAVAYAWYLDRAIRFTAFLWRFLFLIEFAALTLLLVMTFQLRRAEATLRPEWAAAAEDSASPAA